MKKRGGNFLKSLVVPIAPEFKLKDALQVIIGASILAVPVGFTQETWDLGGKLGCTTCGLPMINVLGLLALTVIFLAMFTHFHYHHHSPKHYTLIFLKRVFFTYLFSFIIVAVILALIQQAPWQTDWLLAFKRTIIVTFPSSMSGTIADTIK